MAKVNLSEMSVEALMDLRKRTDEMLLERRADVTSCSWYFFERLTTTVASLIASFLITSSSVISSSIWRGRYAGAFS